MKTLITALLICSIFVVTPCFAAKWEAVTNNNKLFSIDIDSYRLQVPHGWLVAARIGTGTALSFVGDESHEWKI